jgi:hypothetical protein
MSDDASAAEMTNDPPATEMSDEASDADMSDEPPADEMPEDPPAANPEPRVQVIHIPEQPALRTAPEDLAEFEIKMSKFEMELEQHDEDDSGTELPKSKLALMWLREHDERTPVPKAGLWTWCVTQWSHTIVKFERTQGNSIMGIYMEEKDHIAEAIQRSGLTTEDLDCFHWLGCSFSHYRK